VKRFVLASAVLAVVAAPPTHQTSVQDLPRGQIIESVACLDNPSETYALYLPSGYAPDWPRTLLVGFHPGARGRAIVETYRAAAEQYGYVVAGSNTSRNGPWNVSLNAARAMFADLGRRFSIDRKRIYLTGHSGGARVAMQIALQGQIAGVIASSAGFADAKPRASVPFVVFGTAGTEDFNYLELRQVDRALKTPHRLAVFNGGHTLPPADVAMDAVEWLELQAMKSGLRARDEALVDRLWQKRQRAIDAAGSTAAAVHLLRAAAEDFAGLRDVAALTSRADALAKDREIGRALAREKTDDDEEARTIERVLGLEGQLRDPDRRRETLADLEGLLSRLSKTAAAPADTPQRQQARRLLRTITMSAGDRSQDSDYLALIGRYKKTSGDFFTIRGDL
jgi:pimeloyl-ACP methyl ester carboxylesterase